HVFITVPVPAGLLAPYDVATRQSQGPRLPHTPLMSHAHEVARPLGRHPPESPYAAERFQFDVATATAGPVPHRATWRVFRRSRPSVHEPTVDSGSAVQFRPTFAADSAESGTKLKVLGPLSSTSRHYDARHHPRAGRTCTGSSQGPRNHGKRRRERGTGGGVDRWRMRERCKRRGEVAEGMEEAGGARGMRGARITGRGPRASRDTPAECRRTPGTAPGTSTTRTASTSSGGSRRARPPGRWT